MPRTKKNVLPEDSGAESYAVDYKDRAAAARYWPWAAYFGLLAVILIGALIIAFSILVTSTTNQKASDGSPNANLNNFEVTNASNPNQDSQAPINIVLAADAPFLGSATAPVTMVEYADFQCPFCKEFHDSVFNDLKSRYIATGQVKFYYQTFPFLGPESLQTAIASQCANDQGKFWSYHDLLYDNQKQENSGVFSDDNLKKWAKQIGLSTTTFAKCFTDPATGQKVAEQMQQGQNIGVNATPTIFINGHKLEGVGAIGDYQQAINQAAGQN